jgi:hypothetical protein
METFKITRSHAFNLLPYVHVCYLIMLSVVRIHGNKILFLHIFENQILQKYTYKGKSEVALVFRHYTMKAYSGQGHKAIHRLYFGM